MNSNSPWQKHFSQKNRSFYYFNVKDHSSLWVVESCEEGWGRTLIDPKHPERGEKYVNILTNRVFYSEGASEIDCGWKVKRVKKNRPPGGSNPRPPG